MNLELKGRKVLVTGASQGIGKDLATGFASEGCDLYLVTRSAEKLTSIATDLRQRDHVQVRILAADLTAPGRSRPSRTLPQMRTF